MATHLSALKRARQNKKRRLRNIHVKSTVATYVKRVKSAIERNDLEGAEKAMARTIPVIQRAHAKGVFHKNTSSRKISRLTRGVNALRLQMKGA